ncbi:MAG: hypothetical protein HDR57_00570 [Treponema sp.]|nr:hypothetical protein [Treponema sp.]
MTRIHFLNVKEGDCSIIEHDSGRISVIDVCCARNVLNEQGSEECLSENSNAGKGNFNQEAHPENPIDYLKGLGVKQIFRYIQTHPDMDHMDGIKDLFGEFEVLNFWDIENDKKPNDFENRKYQKKDLDYYKKIRKSKENPKTLYYHSGDVNQYYKDDGISIIAPSKELCDEALKSTDYNDASYVLLFKVGERKVIFAGDSGKKTWDYILKEYKEETWDYTLEEYKSKVSEISDIDLLIAPHHGRKSGGNDSYLDVLKPKLTLFGNAPSEYLDYASGNNRKLCHITNNQAGSVVVEISSDSMKVYVSNETFAKKYRKKENISPEKFAGKDYFHIANL